MQANGPVVIDGIGAKVKVAEAKLFLGNAGTAMRPLTAALAVLRLRRAADFEVSGVPRMHERPIGDPVDACAASAAPSTTSAKFRLPAAAPAWPART